MSGYQAKKDEASGRLFTRDATGNQPNWQGDILMSPEMAVALAQLAQQRGADVRLRISAWNKDGPKGMYISIAAQVDRLQPGDDPAILQQVSPGYPMATRQAGPRPAQPGPQRQPPYRQPGPGTQQRGPAQPIRGGHFQTPAQPRGGQEFDDNPNFHPGEDAPWKR